MCLPQGLLFPDWAAGTIPSSLVVTEGALAAAWNWLWRDSYYGWATRVIDAGHLSWGSVSASCPVLGEVETGRPCSVGIVPVPRQGVWLVTHPEML